MSEAPQVHATRPGWGWSMASAALVVGAVAIVFPVAPFWCLLWLVVITLVLRLTPLGGRLVQGERSAILAGLVSTPRITERPVATAVLAFLPFPIVVAALAWDLSDPGDLWNGGILFVVAVFGFLAWVVVQELRSAGHRARWWPAWVVLATVCGLFFLVGGPARARWAYCEDRLTRVVAAGEDVTEANTGSICWHDATQRVVEGDTRLYVDTGDSDGSGAIGLVYSPDGAVESAGDIKELTSLGDGWYWFETGSLVRNFWFEA